MDTMTTHRPDPMNQHLWHRIPVGPRGFPILAANGCAGNVVVDGRSVYCLTCGQNVAWRQVAHTLADDRDFLRERMLAQVDYERSQRSGALP